MNEALEELRLTMAEDDPQYGLAIPFLPSNVGLRFPADSAYEVSVEVFPLRDGEVLSAFAETLDETLLTINRSGDGGRPAPGDIVSLLEHILMDVLPCVQQVAWQDIEEQFAEGDSPIVLLNNLGMEVDISDVKRRN